MIDYYGSEANLKYMSCSQVKQFIGAPGIQKCEANGWNLRTTRLIFSGGTSELLKEEIKSVLPGATILAEPAKANVRGFLKAVTE